MADNQPLVAGGDGVAANPNPENQQQFSMFETIKSMAMRMLFFWIMMGAIRSFFGQNNAGPNSNYTGGDGRAYQPSTNLYAPNTLFDFYFYLSPNENVFRDFDNADALVWSEKGLRYGDWESGENNDGSRVKSLSFKTPAALLQNQSYYLHAFFLKSGKSPNPRQSNYAGSEVIHGAFRLNKFKKKHYKLTQNLLTGKTEQTEEDQKKAAVMKYETLNYFHPNLTVNLVNDYTAWTKGQIPSPLDQYVKFHPETNKYYPVLFFNNYWNLGSEYFPINETVKELNLTITYAPLSLFKWQLYASQQNQAKWSQMLNAMGGEEEHDGDDQDTIKQALLETNPYLLAVTVLVSLAHTVFEFLAFKNDIQFWKNRKSMEGLSVRSVLFNVFQSTIVFLYICDNDSSFVIKISIGVGLLIEMWKIPKCMNVEVIYDEKFLGIFPKIRFSDKGSYVESSTKQYDELAFKYLSWLMFPLLVCYAIYSLMYDEQRGWYSFILSTAYGFLLTTGFIMMTPQLFINYKLKSVAHLPWRMLTYKFINTFIDDLFAFVIRMPTMYRIGCFRDDLIFIVYLYQRWAYRVDPKRVNEYGTSLEHPEGEPEEQQNAIEAAPAEEQKAETKKDK
ncbi:Cleft lip and palate transmembrane protein 1 [Aphelenchoides bicaudatus]|nr:Cleft lip and palate transmembrane protein 1 [Aphelenchoides bicaudatus]